LGIHGVRTAEVFFKTDYGGDITPLIITVSTKLEKFYQAKLDPHHSFMINYTA
jgi:hypothetical protein